VGHLGQHLAELGLARARRALGEERLLERERQEERRLHARGGDVARGAQAPADVVEGHGAGRHWRPSLSRSAARAPAVAARRSSIRLRSTGTLISAKGAQTPPARGGLKRTGPRPPAALPPSATALATSAWVFAFSRAPLAPAKRARTAKVGKLDTPLAVAVCAVVSTVVGSGV